MANKLLEMRRIKKIFQLHSQGLSKRKISEQLEISRNTVRKYLDFFSRYKLSYYEIKAMSIEELTALFATKEKQKSEKLKTLEQYFPYFDKELKRTGVTQKLLWQEYKQKHPEGLMFAQFHYWYSQWRKEVSPVMHFTHKAGDKLFIDFTGKKLSIVAKDTGEVQYLEVFVCVLGSSQYTYAEACESQSKEAFIQCIENALWFYEGVPRALVTDNLKAAVKKSSRYEPSINETFADFAEHYETSVLPTRTYKPKDKAIVENTVRIIYNRVFAPLRNEVFHSKSDLNKAIIPLLKEHNNASFRNRSYSRYSLFEEVEKSTLFALPARKYELKHYANATVHKNSHVYLNKDKHYYSVPYKYIGKRTRVIYSDSLVEVYYKSQRIATHSRSLKKYDYTTDKEHMPSYHRFITEWSSQKFISWAHNIGQECEAYIIKILDKKQHPEQSYKSCLGILHLAKKVGNQRLNNACKRALDYGAYNYKLVVKILENGWDKIDDSQDIDTTIPEHKNIRGKEYYK